MFVIYSKFKSSECHITTDDNERKFVKNHPELNLKSYADADSSDNEYNDAEWLRTEIDELGITVSSSIYIEDQPY